MYSDHASGCAAKCPSRVSIPARGDALGVVLHCPASSWKRTLDAYAASMCGNLQLPGGVAPAHYLVHMVQVPDADGAMHASGQELPALGGLKWPSGLYDRARLQDALDIMASSVRMRSIAGSEMQNIGHSDECSSPPLPASAVTDAGRADDPHMSAEATCCGSRLVHTGAAHSAVVLNMVYICGDVGVLRELLALTGDRAVDVHAGNEYGLWAACRGGHVDVVRELLALTGDRRVDVHAGNERGFRVACVCGHVDVVRELLALTGDRAVDVHAGNERGFRWACRGGHVDVVRELLALTGDRALNTSCGSVLHAAYSSGNVDVVRELLALTGDRAVNAGVLVLQNGIPRHGKLKSNIYWGQSAASCARQLLQYTDSEQGHGQLPSTAVADFCTYLLAAYCGDAPDDALYVLSLVAGRFPPGLPLPNLLSDPRDQTWTYPRRTASAFDLGGHSACMQAALDACTHDTFRRPALAHQVIQQVLMHALEARHGAGGVQGVLRRYCVLLAALPAAECAPLRHVLQRHTHACGTDSCQLHAGAVHDGAGATSAPQECLVVQCASQLRDVVWHGVRVPGQSVRYQVDEGDLRQALVRQGRRGVLLHRVASMAARRAAVGSRTRVTRHRY